MSDNMIYSVMSHNIISIVDTATLEQAEEIMSSKRIRHLPVTNAAGRIIGILSDRDLRKNQYQPNLSETQVRYFMSFPIREVSAQSTIGDVAQQMLQHKISSFLVVDEFSAPCGIVTTDDMLRYLVDLTKENEIQLRTPVGMIFQYLKSPTYE